MIVFNGKKFAEQKEKDLKKKVSKFKITPKLVSVLVGDDSASILYTNLKRKAGERIGINFEVMKFPDSISPAYLVKVIKNLNNDSSVNGIMVQLPLPLALRESTQKILNNIDPVKDVDGQSSKSKFIPAAAKAVIRIIGIARQKVNTKDEKIVVVGGKGMVGKSVSKELKNLKYKVKAVDIKEKDLKSQTQNADILISATGVPNLIKGNMVRQGAVVIDVGSPKADVDMASFTAKGGQASLITPVPGGVGPVTIVSLLENLIQTIDTL